MKDNKAIKFGGGGGGGGRGNRGLGRPLFPGGLGPRRG